MNAKRKAPSIINNEKVLEYKSLVHKIENMINEIKEASFDTLKYEELLRNIKKNTDELSFQSVSNEILKNGKLVIDYSRAIEQLKSLEQLISLYDKYTKAVIKCRYVLSKLNKENKEEEIKYYAFMIIEVLKEINGINNVGFLEEEIVLEIYNIAYKVIKTELVIYDHSDVYDYIKNNQIDSYFIDKLIHSDVVKILLDKQDDDKVLKEKNFSINMKVHKSYFDLELIKLIIMNSDLEYRDRIIKKVTGLKDDILDRRKEINDKFTSISNINASVNERKRNSSNVRQRVTVKIGSVILTLSILVSGGVGLFKLIKNNCYSPVYKKTTTYYSEYTDETEVFSEEIKGGNGLDDEVFVKVYSAWDENDKKSRTVKKYDFSELNLETIYEYLEIELSRFHQAGITQRYSYDLNDNDKYNQEYKTVEMVKYTKLNKEILDVTTGISCGILGDIAYLCLIFILYLFVTSYDYRLKIKEILSGFFTNFETLSDNKRLNMRDREIIVKNLKELLDMIMEDEEKRFEFNRLFEENKCLLNDFDKLMEKFDSALNDMDNKDVKRLVKKYM